MGVTKEYMCKAHGLFETNVEPARCPYGCKTIVRYFSQAPNVGSGAARRIDAVAKAQARHMGVTDMSQAHGRSMAANAKLKGWSDKVGMPDMSARTIDVGGNLAQTLGAAGVQPTDHTALIGRGQALQGRTRAYVDPRGDPKLE